MTDILEGNQWFEMLRKNWFWALFAVVAIYALIGSPFAARKRRRRSESLREVAQAMNLEFAEHADLESVPEVKNLHSYPRDKDKRLTNMMRGNFHGVDVFLFDAEHFDTAEGGKSDSTEVVFHDASLQLPTFYLMPNFSFMKVAKGVGMGSPELIEFENAPLFSKHHLLFGKDKVGVRKLFQPDVIQLLETREKLSINVSGGVLWYSRLSWSSRLFSGIIPPEGIQPFLSESWTLFHLLKEKSAARDNSR